MRCPWCGKKMKMRMPRITMKGKLCTFDCVNQVDHGIVLNEWSDGDREVSLEWRESVWDENSLLGWITHDKTKRLTNGWLFCGLKEAT